MEVIHGGIYFYQPPFTSEAENAALLMTSGSEQNGWRPWIIVSQNSIHANKSTAVGVPLTTKVDKANAYRILLPASELIADEGHPPFHNSVAPCDHVRVLDLLQIRERAGVLTENARFAVGLGLAYLFDLR